MQAGVHRLPSTHEPVRPPRAFIVLIPVHPQHRQSRIRAKLLKTGCLDVSKSGLPLHEPHCSCFGVQMTPNPTLAL